MRTNFIAMGLSMLYGPLDNVSACDTLPRVALHSPYFGDTREKFIPNGKPAIVFAVSTATGLVRLDFIRAVRFAQPRFGDRLEFIVVLVDLANQDPLVTVETAREQRALWKLGLGGEPEVTQLKDVSGDWYSALGRPKLPNAMLVDAQGRIIKRGLFRNTIEPDLERIAAVLAGREPITEEEPVVPPHPFYKAFKAVSPVNGAIDCPGVVRALAAIDKHRASRALELLVEDTSSLTMAREIAQAWVDETGDTTSAWATRVLESQVSGRVAVSANAMHMMVKIENPSSILKMSLKVSSELTRADGGSSGRFVQTALLKPASEVVWFNSHFEQVNGGWGDYVARHNLLITMSEGDWGEHNYHEHPSWSKRMASHVVFAPHHESDTDLELPQLRREADAAAVWEAYEETFFTLRYLKADIPQNPAASAAEAVREWLGSWESRAPGGLLSKLVGIRSSQSPLVSKRCPPIRATRWIQGRESLGTSEDNVVLLSKGSVYLLDFMFTDCIPCRLALPRLRTYHEEHKDRGFVAVSLCAPWGADGLARMIGNLEISHPVAVFDEDTATTFALEGYPTYVLVDRQGVVRWTGTGAEPPLALIQTLIAEEN